MDGSVDGYPCVDVLSVQTFLGFAVGVGGFYCFFRMELLETGRDYDLGTRVAARARSAARTNNAADHAPLASVAIRHMACLNNHTAA